MRELLRRLRYLLQRRRFEADLAEEMEFHREMATRAAAADGQAAADARASAARAFGSDALARDESRDVWSWLWLRDLAQDLRHGTRVLLAARGWTAVVVISLALGIGANAVLFSALNGLLLRKLAVAEPDTLVRFHFTGRNQLATNSSDYGQSNKIDGQDVRATFSYSIFEQFVASNRTLSDLFACAPAGSVNLIAGGDAALADAFFSSGNYYRVLGIRAQLGRTIDPDDDRPGAPPVAVLGDRYWRTRFAADPGIVGRQVVVNGVPVTIVGVLPSDYRGVQKPMGDGRDISMPISLDGPITGGVPARVDQPTYFWLQVMGRLNPGVSVAQAQANFENTREVPTLHVDSGSRGIYDPNPNDVRAVGVLSVVVGLVLLIVCANVANLLLSRAAARQRELSVRLSLGATRGRLVRQLLTESLLLAGCGSALGILASRWGQTLLPGALSADVPIDWHFLAFAIAATLGTGVLFGTAPAFRATRATVNASLKSSSRSFAPSRARLSQSLLVAQVAISILLLVGAALFLRTLDNLRHVDIGFNSDRLLLFNVNPQLNRYDDAASGRLYGTISDRLQAVGGVQSVGLSRPSVLGGGFNDTRIFVRGAVYHPDDAHNISRMVVSPSFFDTLGMTLLRGRPFAPSDLPSSQKVAIVNETAARQYFANSDAIGARFGSSSETSATYEVVAVVSDIKYTSLRDPAPPTMYVPYTQSPPANGVVFELRTAGDPLALVGAVRDAVRQIDSNLPVTGITTQVQNVEGRLTQERVFARAYAIFGGLAAVLAAIGLFGLMSHSVGRRTNEIAIRMALGAQRGDMLRLVLTESMALVAGGAILGVAAALGAGRYLAAMLFGIVASDFWAMSSAVGLMFLVAAIAAYLPARRAATVDPMTALRCE